MATYNLYDTFERLMKEYRKTEGDIVSISAKSTGKEYGYEEFCRVAFDDVWDCNLFDNVFIENDVTVLFRDGSYFELQDWTVEWCDEEGEYHENEMMKFVEATPNNK